MPEFLLRQYQPRQTNHLIGCLPRRKRSARLPSPSIVQLLPSSATRSQLFNTSCLQRRIVMRIAAFAFLILVNQVLAGGGGGKHHVHFKIHVPDIIKHHIHTKTVFIHVHHGGHGGGGGKKKMVPKKKETHHEESHHEDWNSWSSYDVHGGHGNGHEHKQHGTKDTKTSGKGGHGAHYAHDSHGGHGQGYGHGYIHGNDPYRNVHSQMLAYDPGQLVKMQMQDILHSQYIGENAHPVPPQNLPNLQQGDGYHGGGLVGYSHPPQYGMQQDLGDVKHVKETSHNDIEPYHEAYEEGYRKGHHSQTGHLLSKDLNNFYDNKFEEGDFSNNGYDDQSFDKYKTHDDSTNHDTAAADHDGYNYRDGDSYLSSIMDAR